MNKRLLNGFYIGDFHIEPLTGSVKVGDKVVHLPSKSIEVLMCLASNPLTVVTHQELITSVWGESVGSRLALSNAIGQIRGAMNDDPDHPRFIQTLPKRGYRLLVEPGFDSKLNLFHSNSTREESAGVGLIDNLNRRGVLETGVAYLVIGWLLMQIADVTFDKLALPEWVASFVTYFVIAGFPIALVLAWFLEFTDSGAKIDRDPSGRPGRKAFSTKYVSIVGGLLVASVAVFIYDSFVGLPGATENEVSQIPVMNEPAPAKSTPIVDPASIAVLPFVNIDGGEETRILSDGLVEDIINRLAAVPGLKVSSRGDSFTLPGNSSSKEVRNRLRVAYYLEGSTRITNNTIRIVAQLINSEDGFHIVSRSFDRQLNDFFEIQDEITRLIVANLRVALPSSTELIKPVSTDTSSFDAYIEYRRGMDILNRPMREDTIVQALDMFNRSLAVDEEYAAAHAGICLAYSRGYDFTLNPAYIGNAESACASALELNPNLRIVHNALGSLYTNTGRYDDAERAFKQSLALNENDVTALTGLADVYLKQQRLNEAEEKYRQAIGLQPGNWETYSLLGGFLFSTGQYAEAAKAFREVVSLDSKNINGWSNLASTLMLSGDFAAATTAFERALERDPSWVTYSNLGIMYYYLGLNDKAIETLEKGLEKTPENRVIWSNLGDVKAVAGDHEGAMAAFDRAEILTRKSLDINNMDANTTSDLAWITAMLDRPEEARRYSTRAIEIAPADPYVHYINALVLTRTGDKNTALDSLDSALTLGYPLVLIEAEPNLELLRSEPGFRELVGK